MGTFIGGGAAQDLGGFLKCRQVASGSGSYQYFLIDFVALRAAGFNNPSFVGREYYDAAPATGNFSVTISLYAGGTITSGIDTFTCSGTLQYTFSLSLNTTNTNPANPSGTKLVVTTDLNPSNTVVNLATL